DVNSRDSRNRTPLLALADTPSGDGNLRGVARMLVHAGADVNARGKGGVTALMQARLNPVAEELACFLVEAGDM
ncbi:MAG: hypothetical protein LC667_07305, partial [Thioalkalivibrio sp.]|nr:hypothetical protein [Thioalkalivibrio sp.]